MSIILLKPALILSSSSWRRSLYCYRSQGLKTRHFSGVQILAQSDLEGFYRRVTSCGALKDIWQVMNDGLEHVFYDVRRTARHLDRQFSVTDHIHSCALSAVKRARQLEQKLRIQQRWRAFLLDFSRNWPRYQRELRRFLEMPIGRSCATVFFVWFTLSGWWFKLMILTSWILPVAASLFVGVVANNFVIEGLCPACKRRFVGYRHEIIRCTNCRSIVWQPEGNTVGGSKSSFSSGGPDIIDIEIE